MKRFFAALLALVMVLSMTGCARDTSEPMTAIEPAAEETQTDYYPMTVTDQAGRSIMIKEQPRRIVSGYYISSSLLIALGQADRMVGIEAKAGSRNIYALSAPELQQLPSVGSAKTFDLEGCAALSPDLVILPLKLRDAADALTELGISTILVNPENQELLREMTDLVAAALNCTDRAQELHAFTVGTKIDLEARLGDAPRPAVYMASNSSLLATAGGKMYQNNLIELAGGRNVAAELEDSYWAEISYEQLLAWNPDYIFLAADASYSPREVLEDPNLAGITAVAEGRVYRMPNHAEAWDSPVPGSILGSYWMASRLHSDLVTEEACNQVVGDFYETFYRFDYGQA